jgi:hypothetical protein
MISPQNLIRLRQAEMAALKRSIEMIETIPLKGPVVELSLEYQVPPPAGKGRRWHFMVHPTLCIPRYFNEKTLIVEVLAGHDAHPLKYGIGRTAKEDPPFCCRIRYEAVQSWRIVDPKEFALYVGAQIKSPKFLDILSGKVKLPCTSSSTPKPAANGTPT